MAAIRGYLDQRVVWESSRMSAENVEAIRQVYSAMARGDFWAARKVFDPRDFFKAWDWFRQEAEEFIEVGDDVLVITRTHARMKGSEREVEGNAAELWAFRGGKVIRHKSYDSPAEALEAAGLTDEQGAD
jgi:hypothetical protein